MDFDVAHVERVAVFVREAAHRLDVVGHLAQLDAVEPVGRVEQSERADIAEALAADLAEARRIEPEQPGIDRSDPAPVAHQRVGRLVEE
jgi:hypothetical protein